MIYKSLILKTLQIYLGVLLVSLVVDFGYSAFEKHSIFEPFIAWVYRQFTVRGTAIKLIVAAGAAYYLNKKEQVKQ